MSSEFFETKVIKWRDTSNDPYQDVFIILQNNNGPCPLVALVNTLILKEPADQATSPSLSLRSFTNGKKQVSVNGLLEIMGDILLANNSNNHQDVHHVLSYLPKLVTGLNINVRFNGTFVDGPEMALFRMYDIDPIHGWVCDPDYPQWNILQDGSYDESQSILIQAANERDEKTEEPNVDTPSTSDNTPQNLQLTASAIGSFLADYPTQLTPYGLTFLRDLLSNHSLNILFRNDHFSSSYMLNNKLYTLVTDSGYKDEPMIVWQSLTSISGNNDSFYDYTLTKIEHNESESHDIKHHHDEDFLLARKLQEEEDSVLASELAAEARDAPRNVPLDISDAPTLSNRTQPSQQQSGQSSKRKKKGKDCSVM